MPSEYQFCARALREFNDEFSSFRYSEKPAQNSCCNTLTPVSSADSPASFDFVSSFGSQTTLNFGATADSPIRQSSNSSAQKFVPVSAFSQSMTLRYSSETWRAIQTTVCAPRSAAYTSSWPRCLWS